MNNNTEKNKTLCVCLPLSLIMGNKKTSNSNATPSPDGGGVLPDKKTSTNIKERLENREG